MARTAGDGHGPTRPERAKSRRASKTRRPQTREARMGDPEQQRTECPGARAAQREVQRAEMR